MARPNAEEVLPIEPKPCRGYGLVAQPGLELGYVLSTYKLQRDQALSLPSD